MENYIEKSEQITVFHFKHGLYALFSSFYSYNFIFRGGPTRRFSPKARAKPHKLHMDFMRNSERICSAPEFQIPLLNRVS